MMSEYTIVLVVIVVIVLLPFLGRLCRNDCKEVEEHQDANYDQEAGGGAAAGSRAGEEEQQQQLPAAAAAMSSLPPLVCTYRRADGWREGSCGVCLAELEDGEAVRVLPACMHYFHADCVAEWLLAHATCPLCRAPLTSGDT